MDLKDAFFVGKVEQDELEVVLLSYFGQGEHPDLFQYKFSKTTDKDVFIVIAYNSNRKIVNITHSAKFSPQNTIELANIISKELIDDQKVSIGQYVCFSQNRSIEGYFKYKDIFQILPVPPQAPKQEYIVGGHPFLLQYQYISSSNVSVDNARRMKRLTELGLLLHFLSGRIIVYPSVYSESAWVFNRVNDKDWSTSWKQIAYNYDGFTTKPEKYDSVENLNLIPIGERHSNELTLMADSSEILNKVFSSDSTKYAKLIKSLYWYYLSSKTWIVSHSVSYVSLITSIECLLEGIDKCSCGSAKIQKGVEVCDICGEPKYKIGKSIKEFIQKHAGLTFNKLSPQEKRQIYNIRSEMVHGSDIYPRDLNSQFTSYSQSLDDSFHRHINGLVSETIRHWVEN
jgi:Apea-like HEPN